MIQTIAVFVVVGLICIIMATGDNGLIKNMITGTDTASFIYKVGYPIAIGLAIILAIIVKYKRGRNNR